MGREGKPENKSFQNQMTSAWWTPPGIARGMKKTLPLSGMTLVIQSLIGLSVAIFIILAPLIL